MTRLLKKILSWLFPLTCTGCNAEGTALCLACQDKLELFPPNSLENPFTSLAKVGASSHGYENCLDGLASIFIYKKNALLAQLLHLYKYEGMEAYGEALFTLAAQRCPSVLLCYIEEHIDIVTWVPLHQKKLRRRGFNQSRQLALALPCSPRKSALLKRVKNTVAQMSLSRHDRLLNAKGVFALIDLSTDPLLLSSGENGLYLKGKSVLLVDDILTTGATLNSAAEVLKRAGANKVFGLVLARQED